MVRKRDLVIAVLITFCLTAMLFSVRFTRSQTPGQYDPWLDINDDGKILIEDVAWVAKAFGTTGDPTKNVNVTNWPDKTSVIMNANSTAHTYTNTIAPQSKWLFYNSTYGFRKVTISFDGYVSTGTQTYDIYIGFYRGLTDQVDSFSDTATWIHLVQDPPGVYNYTTRTYEVTGSAIWISIWNPAPSLLGLSITVTVSIFMTA